MNRQMWENITKCSLLTALVLTLGLPSYAAPPAPPSMQTGEAINKHDMDMLRQKQFESRERKDFERIQEKIRKEDEKKKKHKKWRKGEIEETSEDETNLESPSRPPVIKATIKEYKTKGVYVESIVTSPSAIIPESIMTGFTAPIIGKNVFFGEIEKVVEHINNYYAENGYITARAFLPEQTIDKGIVKIELLEGRVGNVSIENNKWTKDTYIAKRITAQPKQVFDVVELERDVIEFNRYNEGINLKASLSPGQEYGTTDIKVISQEKFPFHIMGLFDNAGRRTIGETRTGAVAYADSLFGYRDRFSIGSYFSKSSKTPFAEYSIPVNKYDGRVGAVFSMSESRITSGPYKDFNIESKSFNYSAYYSHPLVRKPFFELNAVASGHYKQATTTFDGADINTDKITAAQFSLNARYDTKRGIWYANQSVYQAFPIIQDSSKYFKYEGNITRLHDFGHGIVGQLRGNYQFIPQDVIPFIDQYQAGGLATVRGFSEGVLIGKSGFIMSGELLFPIAPAYIAVKDKKSSEPKKVPFIGKYVKGVLFIDQAAIFPYKGTGPGAEGINSNDYLGGLGPGLRFSIPKDITARIYWGFPMINNIHETIKRGSRFHFEISMAPDIDYILKYRKRKLEEKAQKKLEQI